MDVGRRGCKKYWPEGAEGWKYFVYIFTINDRKAHFCHRKSSKRDILPEIIAKACILRWRIKPSYFIRFFFALFMKTCYSFSVSHSLFRRDNESCCHENHSRQGRCRQRALSRYHPHRARRGQRARVPQRTYREGGRHPNPSGGRQGTFVRVRAAGGRAA